MKIRYLKRSLFYALIAAVCIPAMAEENAAAEKQNIKATKPLTLTIEDAVDYAITNSKSLKSAVIDLEIKKRAKQYSWNVFIPTVNATGTMSRASEYPMSSAAMSQMLASAFPSMTPKTDYDKESERWSAVGNLSFQLNLNLALIDSIRASRASYESGQISWEQTSKETELNIRKMFYALLLLQENLKLQNDIIQNAKDRWDQAEINYRNGLVPQLSVLKAQVDYENKKPAFLELEQSLKQQKDTFAFLLGLPYGREVELVGSINAKFIKVDPNELYSRHVSNRLDVQALQKNIELLKIQLSAGKLSTYTPSLSLNYNWQPVVSDVTSNWFDDDNNFDNGSLSFSVAFNISNLFPFGSNMQSIKDTKQNIEKAEIGLSQLLQNSEIEIHTLVDKLNKSQAAIEANGMNIELAQKAYDMTMNAYTSGTQELLDVRDAENSLSQAKLGLLNEQYNYLSALLDLEYAVNTKLR